MQISETSLPARARVRLDWIVGAGLFIFPLLIYLRTLAPSVAFVFDDSLEFQLLASRIAIAHPTGYPLYSLLIKLATFLPLGDVAYRVNLVSALSGGLAVAFVYLAARQITQRFMNADAWYGEILVRAPALIAALVFAFGETFWSQAAVAEVYTLQAFLTALLLWLTLRWGAAATSHSLVPIAFVAGLMLTHHRMSVLIFPALVVYVLACDRTFLRQPRALLKIVLAFAIPLLLYAYLPIRGTVTSSLDGTYQNTPQGILNWILGTAYTVFITQNPFQQERDASYYFDLFANEFTLLGLFVAVGGWFALFARAWREWLFLALGLAANLVFALNYRVADVNVFFIPTFLFLALFVAAGLAGLTWLAYYALPGRVASISIAVGALLLFVLPFTLYSGHFPLVDLSNKTDVATYGKTILSQPLPQNSTIVGILGEMSLVRYFQETQGLRPDVETIAADKEADRQMAIADALKRNRTVFLTRPLKNIEQKDSLTSVGPLILVEQKPNRQDAPTPTHAMDVLMTDVKFLGYGTEETADPPSQLAIPVTLYWQPQSRIENNRLISLKLLGDNGQLAGQLDRKPVLDAYPTNSWRATEYIADAYDVPIFVGAQPGEYTLQVTMYDPASGQVFGQQNLETVHVASQTMLIPRDLLGVNQIIIRDLGGLQLVGYTFDNSESFSKGDAVPVTLLWRANQAGSAANITLSIADSFGKVVATQQGALGGSSVAAGQYVRQDMSIPLPDTITKGEYTVKLTAQGSAQSPLTTNTLNLTTLEVHAK